MLHILEQDYQGNSLITLVEISIFGQGRIALQKRSHPPRLFVKIFSSDIIADYSFTSHILKGLPTLRPYHTSLATRPIAMNERDNTDFISNCVINDLTAPIHGYLDHRPSGFEINRFVDKYCFLADTRLVSDSTAIGTHRVCNRALIAADLAGHDSPSPATIS